MGRFVLAQREPEAENSSVKRSPQRKTTGGLMSSLLSKMRRAKSPAEAKQDCCIRSAANVTFSGSAVACSSPNPWESCAVFDVHDSGFFEIAVQLLADAPRD